MAERDQGSSSNGARAGDLLLRLYVAGAAPNSLRAVANLRFLCELHFSGRCSLEIIDVLQEPLRALTDDILVTPTLVKLAPGHRTRVIGDLSDDRKVLSALNVQGDS